MLLDKDFEFVGAEVSGDQIAAAALPPKIEPLFLSAGMKVAELPSLPSRDDLGLNSGGGGTFQAPSLPPFAFCPSPGSGAGWGAQG